MSDPPLLAGVELGGTKIGLVIGRGRAIVARAQLPTRHPDETLPAAAAQLARWHDEFHPIALGIASFGPIAIDHADPAYGRILATPKPGWADADIVGALGAGFDGRIALHTDVTGAALAEGAWGAARGLADFVYATIGTGIGLGVIVGGQPVTGLLHPEGGHMRVARVPDDVFPGTCPFHGACLEGLAAGPAIAARAGRPAEMLAPDDPAWGFVADALAEMCATLFLTLASARVVLGGGVAVGHPRLIEQVHAATLAKLGGYLPFIDRDTIADRIAPAALGADAGLIGALELAGRAA